MWLQYLCNFYDIGLVLSESGEFGAQRTSLIIVSMFFVYIIFTRWPLFLSKKHYSLFLNDTFSQMFHWTVCKKIEHDVKGAWLLIFQSKSETDLVWNSTTRQLSYLYYYHLKAPSTFNDSPSPFGPFLLFLSFSHHSVQPHRGHLQVKR